MTLLPEFHDQLHAAARRRARRQRLLPAAGDQLNRRSGKLVRTVPVAISGAIAVLVMVVALTSLNAAHSSRTHRPATTSHQTVPALPHGGMRGTVQLSGVGFASSSNGVISLQECLGCRNGNQTRHSVVKYWLARTSDGGSAWRLAAQRYALDQALFVGRDGWAGGLQATGSGTGGIARYYVTHDGGRTWNVAPAAAPNEGGSLVSIGGGEVWAIGLSRNVAILHADASGRQLMATATQPIRGNWTNVLVTAGGRETAYVSNGNVPRETFVTHDNGRSWQQIPPPCPAGPGGVFLAAYANTVWAECESPPATHPQTVLEWSANGGRTWARRAPSAASAMWRIEPVSARVAWALSTSGAIRRTTDAGRTWSQIWSAASSQPATLKTVVALTDPAASAPILIAQGADSASIVLTLTRGHTGQRRTNLVLYTTTNGGLTWQPHVVSLSPR